MKRSAQTFVPAIFIAACALAIALGARSGSAQVSQCSGLNGAAMGLCNAYCNALHCPDGHQGRACERLLANWQRQTGVPFFPCDAVCCQCATGSLCTTVRGCDLAHCNVIDHCEGGRCPEPQCCDCPAGGCTETTPGNCQRHGCVPKGDAICTASGSCETPCDQRVPCGGNCLEGTVNGTCQGDPLNNNACTCLPTPPPLPCDQRTTCGGDCVDANGVTATCQTDPASNICTCGLTPPPLPCDQRATCGGDCVDAAGVTSTCLIDPTVPGSICTCTPPCANRTTCGGACAEAGVVGTCGQPAAGGPCVCQ